MMINDYDDDLFDELNQPKIEIIDNRSSFY